MMFSHGDFKDEDILHAKMALKATGCIVEIGTLNGRTSRILASNTNIPVIGIDPIIPDSMSPNLIGSIDKMKQVEKDYSNFTFMHCKSEDAVFTRNDIGYLFIDGDHKYEAVKFDFNYWSQSVFIGGYIAIHDSAADRGGPKHWPGPTRLAKEVIGMDEFELIDTVYSTTLFRRVA